MLEVYIAPRAVDVKDYSYVAAAPAASSWKTKKDRREAELARLNRQIQELIRMRTEGLITDKEFLAQKAVLSERRFALEGTPVPERINGDRLHEQLTEIREPLAELRGTWETLPDPFRRRFERLVLPVGFVNGQSRTAELGLLFRAFGELKDANTNAVSLGEEIFEPDLARNSGLC